MTQINYRANLTAAEYPFISDFQGRTIIVPGPDQNFSRQLSSPRNKDKDIGIPQAYYMENMIPTDAGFSSVGYIQVGYPPADGNVGFRGKPIQVRDASENLCLFASCADGSNYVLLAANTAWVKTTTVIPGDGGVTSAHVNGETYIYFGSVGCFKYVFATNILTPVALTSLTPANILGITTSNGFMLAYTKTDLLLSSSVDPTDFTPSLATGAGGGPVQSTKAPITCAVPHVIGIMVYTKKNIVAGYYTGNASYPFTWKELVGSGGLASDDLVAFDGNSTSQYAYTTDGFQLVDTNNASVIFPQLTDFLSGSQYESFDLNTLTFSQTDLSANMLKSVSQASSRYVLVSYGVNALTDIIYYDISLARFGKLKTPHVSVFEYSLIDSNVVETPRRSIGILQADGTVKVVVMSYNVTGSNGVLVLGKYQYDRNDYLKLLKIDLENIKNTSNFNCSVISSINGKDTNPVSVTLLNASPKSRSYGCHTTGINHSVILNGSFQVNSMVLNFVNIGKVR